MRLDLELEVLCGQLIVGGFDGAEPPARYLKALAEGGVAARSCSGATSLTWPPRRGSARRSPRRAAADRPPFIGIDQEGAASPACPRRS